jgi:hypothetical protein
MSSSTPTTHHHHHQPSSPSSHKSNSSKPGTISNTATKMKSKKLSISNTGDIIPSSSSSANNIIITPSTTNNKKRRAPSSSSITTTSTNNKNLTQSTITKKSHKKQIPNKRSRYSTSPFFIEKNNLAVQTTDPIGTLPPIRGTSHLSLATTLNSDRFIDIWKLLNNIFEGDPKEALDSLDEMILSWSAQDQMEYVGGRHYTWNWYAYDMNLLGNTNSSTTTSNPSSLDELSKKQLACLRYIIGKYAGLITSSNTGTKKNTGSSSSSSWSWPALPAILSSPFNLTSSSNTNNNNNSNNNSTSTTTNKNEPVMDEIGELISKLKAEAMAQHNINVISLQKTREEMLNNQIKTPNNNNSSSNNTNINKRKHDMAIDEKYVVELAKRANYALESGTSMLSNTFSSSVVSRPSPRNVTSSSNTPNSQQQQQQKDAYCHECNVLVKQKNKVLSDHFGGPAKCCALCKRFFCRSCLCKTHDQNIVRLATWTKDWICPHCHGNCFSSTCICAGRTLALCNAFNIKLKGLDGLKSLQESWLT